MKTYSKILMAGSLLLACGVAAADTSFNVAATSDYRFRGVSQSAKKPAIQGGFDMSDNSGFYLGAWGSTIDFDASSSGGSDPNANLELDLYGGYKWTGAGIDWDAGMINYGYPGSKSSEALSFTEIYLGGGYGPVNVKYYYTSDFTGTTTDSAYYVMAGAGFDVGGGFALGLSAGRSGGSAFSGGASYNDYKVGVSKDYAGVTFDLSYIDTSGVPDVTTDVFNNESTVVLTVSKTF